MNPTVARGARSLSARRQAANSLNFGLVTLVIAAGFWCVACEEPTPEPRKSGVRDSSGVWIAHNEGPPSDWPECPLARAPDFRLGMVDGPAELEFTDVVGAVVLSDGRIAVLDRSARELRLFHSDGEWEQTVGREGDGPGEFRDPIGLIALPGDTLVVWDRELQRISWYTGQGELVTSVQVRPALANPGSDLMVGTTAPRYWVPATTFNFANAPTFVPRTVLLVRSHESGEVHDTIARIPSARLGVVNAAARIAGTPIFEPWTRYAMGNGQIVVGYGRKPELEIRDELWNLTGLIRWRTADRTVTRAMVDAYREERLAPYRDTPSEALMRQRFFDVPVAEQLPVLSALAIDRSARVWVRGFPDPTGGTPPWFVFLASGEAACVAGFPEGFKPLQFGGTYVLGKTTGQYDAERVERFALQWPPP